MAGFFGGTLSALVPDSQLLRYSSTITIEELTGTSDGGPRRLVLSGPSMPFQGADWGLDLVAPTTFYPGNREGTQQVLGPKEMPANWEGEWNRTLLGKTPVVYTDETGAENKIVQPHLIFTVLEQIIAQGAALRVTWSTHGVENVGDQLDGPRRRMVSWDMVREGRATQLKITPDRHTDIKWSIAWAWYGRGIKQAKTADPKSDNDFASAANALDNAIQFSKSLNDWTAAQYKDGIRLSASHLTLGQLEALADAPNKAVTAYLRKMQASVNDIRRIGNIAKKFRAMPFQIANTVTDFARNTLAIANQFVVDIDRMPPEQMSNKRKVSDMMRAWNQFAKHQEQAAINARRAQNLHASTQRFLASPAGQGKASVKETATTKSAVVLATYITKTGDTPQSVAMKFYGNADRGLDILQANRLPWHTPTFERGKILIIPELPPSKSM